jgi:hypothetical protein
MANENHVRGQGSGIRGQGTCCIRARYELAYRKIKGGKARRKIKSTFGFPLENLGRPVDNKLPDP